MKNLLSRLSIAAVVALFSAMPASAQGFTQYLTNVYNEFLNVRTPLALLGLVAIGFMFLFTDRMPLGRAAGMVIGIIIMFSSPQILALVTA